MYGLNFMVGPNMGKMSIFANSCTTIKFEGKAMVCVCVSLVSLVDSLDKSFI